MADRPRGDGGRGDGTRDFHWLYGSSGDRESTGDADATQVRRTSRPDETRVMPAMTRPTDAPADRGRPTRPTPPPLAPTPRPAKAGRRRGVRFWLRLVLVLLLLWAVYLVAVPLWAWTKVEKVEFEPEGDRPGDQPGTTYLLVGSDSRADLSAEERKELTTGNASGQRTDTIMLLHTGSGPNLLMSIPRDSLVDIPGHGSGQKINAAYAFGGPQLLTRTIEQSTGIRIDSYVEIGLGGVVDVVDAVGGIEVCPEFDMKDPLAGLNIKKGCQEVDGKTALGYARSRHTDPRFGDITRAKHQREVVSAVGHEVMSPWTFANPFRYWGVVNAMPGSFAFGEGTSPVRAAMWASAMTKVNGKDGLTCGVPISDLAVHWDPDRSEQMFDLIQQDKTDEIPRSLCTPTGLPKSVTG